ncbi:MAG TPA: carboxypeptidase regulatory-like domain-containing protein [Oscillatoriaceae cyanobacterium]
MRRAHLLFLSLLLAACSAQTPNSTKAPRADVSSAPASNAATTTSNAADTATVVHTGQVLGEDGNPAAGVIVTATLIGNNGGGVISNNGSGVISNNGSSYRLQDNGLQAVTDAQGDFTLTLPSQPVNLEAVQTPTEKAIQFNVTSGASNLTLTLAHTGTISGKVTASRAPTVTNLLGIDVFVPGTSYQAQTDANGAFTITGTPVGTYALYAAKAGLGNATAQDVRVKSNETASATLDLSVQAPTISAITPAVAGPGATITVQGTNFGASDGGVFAVNLGGAVALNPTRLDDRTIRFTLPDSATTGELSVTVDGIQSNPQPLTVLESLVVPTYLDTFAVGDHISARAYGYDTNGKPVAVPGVIWRSQNDDIAVDASGTVMALTAGKTTLTASIGNVSAVANVNVYAPNGAFFTTLAGHQTDADPPSADGLSDAALFSQPLGMTIDPKTGTLYEAEWWETASFWKFLIRKITPDGQATTLCGGDEGYNDGQGAAVEFDTAGQWFVNQCLAYSPDGNLYLADTANNRVRCVTPAGLMTTFVGDGTAANKDGSGAQAELAAPVTIACDGTGNLYVAEATGTALYKIMQDGACSRFVDLANAGASGHLFGLAIDGQGNLYTLASSNGALYQVTPAGHASAIGPTFSNPESLVADASGDVYVATFNPQVQFAPGDGTDLYKVTTQGGVATKVLTTSNAAYGEHDGPVGTAQWQSIEYPVLDAQGRLFFMDGGVGFALRRLSGL